MRCECIRSGKKAFVVREDREGESGKEGQRTEIKNTMENKMGITENGWGSQ